MINIIIKNQIIAWINKPSPKKYTDNQLSALIFCTIGLTIGMADIIDYICYLYISRIPTIYSLLAGVFFIIISYIFIDKIIDKIDEPPNELKK